MRCLCCGKLMNEQQLSLDEKNSQWHKRCIKKFFGTDRMPILDLSNQQLEELASKTVDKGVTVTGVQKKLSLHLSKCEDNRLTIVDYPTGYILKPQTGEYESLPEFEDLAMRLAEIASIKTVPHALIWLNKEYAYITKRIDREVMNDKYYMYAMEDFCQLGNRLTQDKYKGSYEKCARIIKQYSSRPGIDLADLYIRVLVSYIIGNSDMHMKNFSLIEEKPASRRYYLSAAYDMLPVNIVMPEDKEQLALTINGKKKNIRKKEFILLADQCGLNQKAAEKIIKKICSLENRFLEECDKSYLSDDYIEKTKSLISIRIKNLQE